MSIKGVLRFLGLQSSESEDRLEAITKRRRELSDHTDQELRTAARALRSQPDLVEAFALTAQIAERVLGVRMFDVQTIAALAMQQGHIAEMQTGEGKTLAAVPAVIWNAIEGRGMHVLTANDYLAHRDSRWMTGIYEWFGLSVAHLAQNMPPDQRRRAYQCDVLYATANEIGFDFLRDGLAREPGDLVQRPLAFALIDEADSILIDEARIPLVIAGGTPDNPALAPRADALAAQLRPNIDYVVSEFQRDLQLTDPGVSRAETAFGCANLFDEQNLRILTAIQDALHARVLLRRDVDYVVRNGSVELIDEFKGRIAQNRRWPAGLQSALEAKERVGLKAQGRILGSITVQSLIGMYERVSGMTGTAATQAEELWKVYKLPVTVIPPNRPLIRQDLPDFLYTDKRSRNEALIEEIRAVHGTGRPVLVGTASVEDSEALSRQLTNVGVSHRVLNARNDEAEAAIVAQAGAIGSVTISTNMAGRGTDILLGGNPPVNPEKVIALGGLYVLGTTRHAARRIDHQLRGRAGRQGDPGTSRFFISLEDDLLVRFGIGENPDVDSVQRVAEGQSLQIRELLYKYESLVEHHRREVADLRRTVLLSSSWSIGSLLPEEQYGALLQTVNPQALETAGRRLALAVIDELWSDYLSNVAELRSGIHWLSWGGRDPLYEFLTGVERIYADFHKCLEDEVASVFENAEVQNGEVRFPPGRFERGATWTYLTTDQPFGTFTERMMQGLRRKLSGMAH